MNHENKIAEVYQNHLNDKDKQAISVIDEMSQLVEQVRDVIDELRANGENTKEAEWFKGRIDFYITKMLKGEFSPKLTRDIIYSIITNL